MFGIFFKIFIVLLVIVVMLGTFFYYWAQKDKTFLPRFMRENIYIKLPPRIKKVIKEKMRPFYNWVYQEATKHNPPGDLVPDSLDDSIKKKIKETID